MAKKTGKGNKRKDSFKVAKTSPGKLKTKTASSQQQASSSAGPRQLKQPVKLPSAWRLAIMTARTLWQYRGLFIGITLVYGLLNLILVQGLANSADITSLKHTLNQAFSGNVGSLASGLSIFVLLVSSAGNGSSNTAGAYQLFLALITSLAVIWALRQLLAGAAHLRIRDAYYRGIAPLIPFILVLLVVGLQLLPLLFGATLYGAVVSNGIAVNFIETLLWLLVFAALASVTLYLVSSSLFAVYIVTLPDMTPMKALRSAKELVRRRRWMVLRKILCLPIILLVVAAIIMVPIIIILTPLSQWVFFLLTMFSLVAVHAYMYTLYRELLNE